jgi:hypothetical protein
VLFCGGPVEGPSDPSMASGLPQRLNVGFGETFYPLSDTFP